MRSNPDDINNLVMNIESWNSGTGFAQYIILLDARFHNEAVRTFAVRQLEKMSDADL